MRDDPIVAIVCKCGASPRADGRRCVRGHVLAGNDVGVSSRFAPGNTSAQTHGAWSLQRGRGEAALPATIAQTIEEFRASVISDRGGLENMTTVEVALVRRLSELEATCRLLAADIASKGLLTPRGRVRGVYRQWLESLDRFEKYCVRVGVDRRARVVTLQERLAAAARRDDGEAAS